MNEYVSRWREENDLKRDGWIVLSSIGNIKKEVNSTMSD